MPAGIADGAKGGALDSLVLAPGEAGELRRRAERPGNYLYHANARNRLPFAGGH